MSLTDPPAGSPVEPDQASSHATSAVGSTAASPPPASAGRSERVRGRLDAVLDWAESAGWVPNWLERFLIWWKHFGLVHALAVLIAVSFPFLKFVGLPWAASSMASTYAEGYGVNLEIGDWTASVFNLAVTAHDVKVKTGGQYSKAEILQADAITWDLSLWRRVRTGLWTAGIALDQPTLYLERLNSGRWNWEDLVGAGSFGAPSTPRPSGIVRIGDKGPVEADDTLRFAIPRLELNGLRIQWVENLVGQSGGGLIHTSKATLFIDDVNLRVQDMAGPVERRERPTSFSVEGRTADGRISINGNANFFHWARPSSGQIALVKAGLSADWSPVFTVGVYLENVATAAVGRMVPSSTIMPASGTMTGRIDLAIDEQNVACKTDLQLHNVTYTVNVDSPAAAGRSEAIHQGLRQVNVTRRILVGCEGSRTNTQYRPLNAFQAAVTRDAVKDAPQIVRTAADYDQKQLSGRGTVADASLDVASQILTQQAGDAAARVLGQQGGAAVTQALSGSNGQGASGQGPNPVSKGLKSVGRGFKRIFGGGDDKKKK